MRQRRSKTDTTVEPVKVIPARVDTTVEEKKLKLEKKRAKSEAKKTKKEIQDK